MAPLPAHLSHGSFVGTPVTRPDPMTLGNAPPLSEKRFSCGVSCFFVILCVSCDLVGMMVHEPRIPTSQYILCTCSLHMFAQSAFGKLFGGWWADSGLDNDQQLAATACQLGSRYLVFTSSIQYILIFVDILWIEDSNQCHPHRDQTLRNLWLIAFLGTASFSIR